MKPTLRQPDKKIEAILTAARQLFARNGFYQTPVSEVADSAGVAAGTIIYHFKTKENLLFVLAWDALNGIFREALSTAKSTLSGIDAVQACVSSFFDCLKRNPDGCIIFLKYENLESPNKFAYSDINFDILYRRYLNLLHDVIRSGVEDGTLAKSSPHDTAVWLFSLLVGSAWMVLFRKEDPDQQRNRTLAFVLNALRP